MKKHLLLRCCFALLLLLTAACRNNNTKEAALAEATDKTEAAPTTLYLVRHAEKDISDPANQDPGLTPAGAQRAEALRALLEGQQVDALYATKYIRTKNTLQPLADARQLELRVYEAHDFEHLRTLILEQHQGETVVIAGHSNTILPIIEAFGATPPVTEIPDSIYGQLFKLVVPVSGGPTAEVSQFGVMAK